MNGFDISDIVTQTTKVDFDISDIIGTENNIIKARKDIINKKTAEIRGRYEKELIESMSPLEKGLTGAGAGMVGLARGAGQRLGLVTTKDIEEARRLERPLMETTEAKVGKFVGETAPFVALPGGAAKSILGRVVASALTGAGIGAIQPTGEKEDVIENVLAGGIFGGATAGAMGVGSKIFNAIKGPVKNEMQQLGQKYGIPITLGEIKNSAYVQRVESWLENFGFLGISKFRAKQQVGLQKSGLSLLGEYVVNPGAVTTEAMKEANDIYLTGLYNQVRQTGKILPSVVATKTERVGRSELKDFPNAFEFIQNTKIKGLLKKIIEETEIQDVPTGMFSATGQPITRKITPGFTFEELWALRKGLGDEVGAAPNKSVRLVLNNIRHAVSDDMDTMFSKVPGNAGNQFKTANEEWKRLSLKFDVIREA